jgi:putative sterol carrier protein
MTDPTTTFFERLQGRSHEPGLAKLKASVRFDLKDGKRTHRWYVAIDRGDIAVSNKNAAADCVVRADSSVFEGVARCEVNPVAAVLRGAIQIEGDPDVFMMFRRLTPLRGTES